MSHGTLSLVLHAHLPFVRHPEYDEFLEEDWLFEAMTETYIPLLAAYERLVNDGCRFQITMSVTPPLAEMLSDPLLQSRYRRQLDKHEELAEKEVHRTRRGKARAYNEAAQMYRHKLAEARRVFDKWGGNLVNGFKAFQDQGVLEVITCGATHGFLPLMASREAVHAQIQVAKANYEKHFGRPPRGIWLPECGYGPGVSEALAEAGIRYFFVDAHGLLYGSPRPKYGVFAPVYCPKTAVAAFGRDVESSRQVWSRDEGYPGDPNYREFYRDLGYDADLKYIRPYLHSDGVRRNIGFKYHRITGNVELCDKQPYSPQAARERTAEHASNFLFNRQQQIEHLHGYLDRKPIVVAPYDAELFGHWWYEGPMFIEHLCRKAHFDQNEIVMASPWTYLQEQKVNQIVEPSPSSWGDKGYNEVWLNGSNDWVYRHLHRCEARMVSLAKRYTKPTPLELRTLNQLARELLLAQSSDWAFIMTTATAVSYAERRTRDHIHRFNTLADQMAHGGVDVLFLDEAESRDSIFQEIDYRVYAPRKE